MHKIKSLNWNGFLITLKCCLIGLSATLIGTIIFAVVLKFANLSSIFISYINDIIKVLSIFIMVTCLKRNNGEKLIFKSLFAGLIYGLLSYVIFSFLNGGFNFNISFIYDLLFALIVSAIVAVIINILNKKTV